MLARMFSTKTYYQYEKGRALAEYRRMLAQCSNEELQDIYFHIDVLRYPERYRAVLDELRWRRLQPVSGTEPGIVPQDIPQWVFGLPALRHRRSLAAIVAFLILTGYTALVTFLFCLPLYVMAVPFGALNQQGALFYLIYFPFAPLNAAGFGRRAGGKKGYSFAVALGVAVGIAAFVGTGTLQLIVQALFRSEGSGGLFLPTQ